ncbi:phage protein NinX family protein [Pseudomonas lundensis]|uniref:phage protein NinX family protein n=1 Tax=Pseudomonas lundensis TaxID=86185 RepID=UPI0014748E19|nr:phage protein NinX family protein [Pseudomonas lundensis]NNA39248.1 DUF2591 family protein [Pseudomonas lundensis]
MSEFVEVKTQDLTRDGLNWAVAKAEGYEPMLFPHSRKEYSVVASVGSTEEGNFAFEPCFYCTDWAKGGPLIEKHAIEFEWITDATLRAEVPTCGTSAYANSYLTAACRAIVASVLGNTVSVPKVLMV